MKSIEMFIMCDQIPKGTAQMKRANFKNGTFFEGKDLKEARAFYMDSMAEFAPEMPIDGPIGVDVIFYYSIKDKRKKGTWKASRPDCDNLVKLLLDCMTKLNFWHDDAQIARLIISKKYSHAEFAGISIFVKELEVS